MSFGRFLHKFGKALTNPTVIIDAMVVIALTAATIASGGLAGAALVAYSVKFAGDIALAAAAASGPGNRSGLPAYMEQLSGIGTGAGLITVGSQVQPAIQMQPDFYAVGPGFDPRMEQVLKAEGVQVQRIQTPGDAYMLRQQLGSREDSWGDQT